MINTLNIKGMMLIADSGSTKTDWVLIDQNKTIVATFSTKGLNPNILSDEQIGFELKNEIQLNALCESQLKLFFYGAGCSGAYNLHRMHKTLRAFFLNATIEIKSDM